MQFEEFHQSLNAPQPPTGLSQALQALWYDARGDWDQAHQAIQDEHDSAGSWVHAYLHRKEGDLANANYWYRRAGKPTFTGSLQQEWQAIAKALC